MFTEIDYMRMAYEAALESPDPSTQNGAVLVDNQNGRVLATASNTFPDGVEHKPERLERPAKYNFIEHAERNACFAVGDCSDTTMYVLWAACPDCSRAIIQSGVTRVVTHEFYHYQYKSPDAEDRIVWTDGFADSFAMLEEAGVEVIMIDDEIQPDVKLRFNGEEISF